MLHLNYKNLIVILLITLVDSVSAVTLTPLKVGVVNPDNVHDYSGKKITGPRSDTMNCFFEDATKHNFVIFPTFTRLFKALDENKIDITILTARSAERDKYGLFASFDWRPIPANWYFLEKNRELLKQKDRLLIGYRSGSMGKALIDESKYTAYPVKHTSQLIRMLELGRIDVFVDAPVIYESAVKKKGIILKEKISSKQYSEFKLGSYFSRKAVKKNPKLLENWKLKHKECAPKLNSL